MSLWNSRNARALKGYHAPAPQVSTASFRILASDCQRDRSQIGSLEVCNIRSLRERLTSNVGQRRQFAATEGFKRVSEKPFSIYVEGVYCFSSTSSDSKSTLI
jgi:hypothetical protein